MRRTLAVIAALTAFAPAWAHAWCRMTTSDRAPTPAMPCVYPDPSANPPEHYLEWLRPCSAIALSTAASRDLTQEQVIGVFTRAIETWESVECSGTPLGVQIGIMTESSTCTGPLYRDGGGNVNAIMFVTDWGDRMYDTTAFAVTTVWHRKTSGEILDVDMEINELRGPYGICPPDGCLDRRTVDLEDVVTHELGHYLGLAHSTDPETTMFASAVAGETVKRDLAPDDIEGICNVYPPGTPAGECDYTPKGGLVLDCNTGGCSVSPGAAGSPLALAAPLSMLALRLRRRRPRS